MSVSKESKYETYERAEEVARYYGFLPLDEVVKSAQEHLFRDGIKKTIKLQTPKDFPGEIDRTGLMKAFLDYNFSALPQPVMIYHSEPLKSYMERSDYGGKDGVLFSLEIIGSPKSIAEALLLKTTSVILEESGFDNITIDANSLGDKESIVRFTREFSNFCKKHMDEMPSHCKNNLKKDVFKVLECQNEKCAIFREHAPKPLGSLSENSRTHFAEVLEFLESMDIPYNINNSLTGEKDCYTKSIFEIKNVGENKLSPKKKLSDTLARGGRYDELSKQLGNKKEIPAVGISISMGGFGLHEPKEHHSKRLKKPKAFLIHLGFEAKIKSLKAIEILRHAKIPIFQSLSKDRLSAQITNAENTGIPYMIIIGHKEALEGTAIVRDMGRRCQETVSLKDIPSFLKGMEK